MAHRTDLDEFRRQWQEKMWAVSDIACIEKEARGTRISTYSYGSLYISTAITSFELKWQEWGANGWQVLREPREALDELTLGLGGSKLVLRIPRTARLTIKERSDGE
jgi:hypothetical protein